MSTSDVVELSVSVFFFFSSFGDVKQLDRSAMFLLEMFLSVWSEKLVFTGQQTVIFLRLANSSYVRVLKLLLYCQIKE